MDINVQNNHPLLLPKFDQLSNSTGSVISSWTFLDTLPWWSRVIAPHRFQTLQVPHIYLTLPIRSLVQMQLVPLDAMAEFCFNYITNNLTCSLPCISSGNCVAFPSNYMQKRRWLDCRRDTFFDTDAKRQILGSRRTESMQHLSYYIHLLTNIGTTIYYLYMCSPKIQFTLSIHHDYTVHGS